jgi:hypothetical protein
VEILQWGRKTHLLPSGCQAGWEEIRKKEGEEEEEKKAERAMVSKVSFIQANLQHNISASRIITRTGSVKRIHMTQIQKPWHCEDCTRGLNIPGYNLYSAGGMDRPKACILAKSMNTWVLPGSSCRDLVAVPVKYIEDEAERRMVVPLICHSIPGSSPIKGAGGTHAKL